LSTSSSSKVTTNDQPSANESSTDDDDVTIDDYPTSDEEVHDDSASEEQDRVSKQSSSSEDDISISSEEEQFFDDIPTNVSTDPTLVHIRSLIKRVRELVGVVRQSSSLSEYIRKQAKEKKLPGQVSDQKEKFRHLRKVLFDDPV